MDIVIIILGTLLLAGGFIGCFVPVIPGPVLAYAAILLRHFFVSDGASPYSVGVVLILGGAMVAVTVLDYIIPSWITRKAGGSKYGARGALIGMLLGIIFTPIGMLMGMFLGALVGELLHNSNNISHAVGVACWSFVGFLLGTGMKCVYCAVVVWQFYFP
jgi:uncharacterized protein YqgC (DUF456 family)